MIETIHSFPKCGGLLDEINKMYAIEATQIYLHRDMIGSVYFLESHTRKYVFKLFRHSDRDQALQSVNTIQYLARCDYPVVSIVSMCTGDPYMLVDMPEGERVGILYDFIDGAEPQLESSITAIGEQVSRLHNLMDCYPGALTKRGKAFFIDRYTDIMAENVYDTGRIDELTDYGSRLWARVEQLPGGFCHGDLHSGNILKVSDSFVLFDFDVASYAYTIIDAATLSNKTNYNHLDESAYEDTRRMFDKFYRGYSRNRDLSDAEIRAIFDFIAIRHYELNATVIRYRLPLWGRHWLRKSVFDEQYEWLMKWEDICSRKSPV